jgi:hypothetical protein
MVCRCPVVQKRHVPNHCPDPDCTDFSDPRNFILINFLGEFFFKSFCGLGFLMDLGLGGRMFYLCFYLSIFGGSKLEYHIIESFKLLCIVI